MSELTSGAKTQAQVLTSVAEDADLAQAEFNKAFVMMRYFGYLRRNSNDTPDANFESFDFWLNKLNQFNGDFVAAQMVKAFINSGESDRGLVNRNWTTPWSLTRVENPQITQIAQITKRAACFLTVKSA